MKIELTDLRGITRYSDRAKVITTRENYPIMKFFAYAHLPEALQAISRHFAVLAVQMAETPRNAETAAGLRKLLEAKDCFVRAALP